MMMMKFYTYELINSITNEIFYIGKGSGERCFTHKKIALGNSKSKYKNPKLYNKIKQIIENKGEIIVSKVLETNNEEEAFCKEVELIKLIGIENLCNLTIGGEGTSYINGFTDKHKENISNSKKGKKRSWSIESMDSFREKSSLKMKENYKNGKIVPFFKGKKLNESTKVKMSESHLNKKFSEEHKINLSNSLTGRKFSEEHKINLSISHKENYNYEFLSYEDCKIWVSNNCKSVKSKRDWNKYVKSNIIPSYIPKSPYWVYKKSTHYSGWISWKNFLNS